MDLAKSLRVAMAQQDISVNQLAEKLGVSRQQVSNMKRTNTMNQQTLKNVSAALNMQVSEFIKLGED